MSENGEGGGLDGRRTPRGTLRIVVGIAIIVAIGLFVVDAARKIAKEELETECRGNLRQIGKAFGLYAQDNGGWTPAIEPEARRIANAAGLAAGSVLTFRDRDGQYKASGLGLLVAGGYLPEGRFDLLHCPGLHGENERWIDAFTMDSDESFWKTGKPGSTDGDGVGELPGRSDVMLCNYTLRCRNPEKADETWGAALLEHFMLDEACVSDLLFLGNLGAVQNHENIWNVSYPEDRFYSSRSVKSFWDGSFALRKACMHVPPEEIENVVDQQIFGNLFAPFVHYD